MKENDMKFCLLCGTLEDAIELIDGGKLATAKALLVRTLEQARRIVQEDKN